MATNAGPVDFNFYLSCDLDLPVSHHHEAAEPQRWYTAPVLRCVCVISDKCRAALRMPRSR